MIFIVSVRIGLGFVARNFDVLRADLLVRM